MLISNFFFICTYVDLIFFVEGVGSLIVNVFFFALYSNIYWNVRHNLEFITLNDKKLGRKVGIISQISEITAGIISAFILDNFSIVPLVIASSILMLISLISFFLMDEKRKTKLKDSLIKNFKIVPKTTLFHLALREASTVMTAFFPLYLYNRKVILKNRKNVLTNIFSIRYTLVTKGRFVV